MSHLRDVWSTLTVHLRLALTLRHLRIRFDRDACLGANQCIEVCPVGCWTPDDDARKVVFRDPERCIACGACVLQCPTRAIDLR